MNGQFDRALTSIGTGICQLEEHIETDRSNAIQTSHGHVINVRLHFIFVISNIIAALNRPLGARQGVPVEWDLAFCSLSCCAVRLLSKSTVN